MNKRPVSYFQTDPKWKNADYSAKGEKTTIGASGCGPTAMSMVLATWADKNVTPKTECAWALAHGYKAPHQGTYYGYFVPAAKRYGLQCWQVNTANIYGNTKSSHHETARKAIENGRLVIACKGKGLWTSSGHYVLVWGFDGDRVLINDPASTRAERVRGDWSLFRKQVKYYWVIEAPKTIKKEEPDMTEEQTRKIAKAEADKALVAATRVISETTKGLAAPIVYKTFDDLPKEWGRPTVRKLLDKDLLQGTKDGLNISYDLLRALVILDRAGVFDGVG